MGKKIDSDKVKNWLKERKDFAIEESQGEFERKYCKDWYDGYIEACKHVRHYITGAINRGELD